MTRNRKVIVWEGNAGQEELLHQETLFHCANGYIGIRGCLEEGCPEGEKNIRGQYINGFYDIAPMKQAEQLYGFVNEKQVMLNVADTQTIRLFADGEAVTQAGGGAGKRVLDMEKGWVQRRFTWEGRTGKKITVDIRRMASFALLPLFTIEYRITAENFSGELELLSVHEGGVSNYSNPDDPRVAAESGTYLVPEQVSYGCGRSEITARTGKSDLWVTTAVEHRICGADTDRDPSAEQDGHSVSVRYSLQAREKQTVTVTKYTIMCDSRRYVRGDAGRLLDEALAVPLETWYARQEAYLEAFWERAGMEVEGDDVLAQSLNFNLYCLLQSASRDPQGNIAAKGLSGEGYEGHYFWDTEMYILPFFMLTQPQTARNFLEFRHGILDYARENARVLGHKKGALFPWRTIMGRECSGYYPSGTAQYHINGDIAYAAVSYYLSTGDEEFLERCGAELLVETARLWMDVGNYVDGTFRINCVTGPDEYTCMVNNNYYTNASAKFNLHWAAKSCRILEQAGRRETLRRLGITGEETDQFEKAARRMYLPYCEALDINPQDDSFLQKERWDLANTPKENFPLLLHYHPLHLYRYQVCKQADTVLAHFIYEDLQPLHTVRSSFDYYEQITTHDSSLSTCIFGIVAARLGMTEKAYRYFDISSKLDLTNAHKNTGDGIHTANMGGTYMGIVYGFGGLRIREEGVSFRPSIPRQWDSYSYRVVYRNSVLEIRTDREQTVFRLSAGEPLYIRVYDRELYLDGEAKVLLRSVGEA